MSVKEPETFETGFGSCGLSTFNQVFSHFFDENTLKSVQKKLRKIIKKNVDEKVFDELSFVQSFEVLEYDSINEEIPFTVCMINEMDLHIEFVPWKGQFLYRCRNQTGPGIFTLEDGDESLKKFKKDLRKIADDE